jgi:hypothetical protein
MPRILSAVAIAMTLSLGLQAEEPAIAAGIKVVSEKNPDASSVEAILASILKPDMTPQQKAEAIFDYLVHHTYHCMPPEEPIADAIKQRKYFGENLKVMDSVKMLNVYGHAICGSVAWVINEFYNAAGLYGRIDGVNGHTICETKYDGKWHYLDIDMMGFVRRPDGTIPSADDIKADKNLLMVKNDKTPAIYFKYDGPNGMWGCLDTGVQYSMYGRKVTAHSMNLTLREGEALTRYFKRQWAPNFRYFYPNWPGSEYANMLKANKDGPRRPETYYLFKEGDLARFGNWEMTYEPPLAKKSSLAGIYQMANVAYSDAAPFLKPEKAGTPSEVVYSYYSPYGCAGCPNDKNNPTDGAVFEGEFASANGTLSYSLDLGKSWNKAYEGGGKFKVDLTPKLQTQYGFLLKLSFDGDGAGIKSFKSYLSGQLSPAALPFVDGTTKMTFTRENTDCLLYAPDITIGMDELKRTGEIDGTATWDENISGHYVFAGNKGGAIFKVEAAGDIVRVQTGAKFGSRKAGTLNGVSFSIDEGKTWIVACQQPIVADEDHSEEFWGESVDGVLDFAQKKAYSPGCTPAKGAVRSSDFEPKPTKTVWVKFHTAGGDGKLILLHGIYVLYKKPGALPLTITHKWTGGEHVEKIKADEASKTYEVKGGAMATNESIKIEATAP